MAGVEEAVMFLASGDGWGCVERGVVRVVKGFGCGCGERASGARDITSGSRATAAAG